MASFPPPDITINFQATHTGVPQQFPNPGLNNLNNGIQAQQWILTYSSTGFSAASVVIESAPDNSGAPGSWVTFPGTVISGSNPSTSTTTALIIVFGYQPWIRVRIVSLTGSGRITGTLLGFVAADQPYTVDASGNINVNIAAGSGGGTSSTFGAAFPATGTAAGVKDSGGNMAGLNLDASGNLKVNVAAGGGSGGTSSNFGAAFPAAGTAAGAKDLSGNMKELSLDISGNLNVNAGQADSSNFVEGLSRIVVHGGEYNTAPTPPSSGQVAAALITVARALQINLRNNAGTEIGTLANAVRVDPVGTTTQPVSGTVTVNSGGGNFNENLVQVAGSNVSTAATGVQKVGIVGNAGSSVDAAVGAGTAPTNMIVAGARFNATPPFPTDTQTQALQADNNGNLKVMPGMAYVSGIAAWTSATPNGTSVVMFQPGAGSGLSGASAVILNFAQTSTITGGVVTIEMTYDSLAWFSVPVYQFLDTTTSALTQATNPYTLQANVTKEFYVLTRGALGLRVRLTTGISGTGTVQISYTLVPTTSVNETIITGGSSIFRLLSTNSTNSNNVKSSAGMLKGWVLTNTNASPRFVKIYDKATAPTVGSDVPALTLVVPGNANGAGMVLDNTSGLTFVNGIGIGVTGAVADSDQTSVGTNEVVINMFYR